MTRPAANRWIVRLTRLPGPAGIRLFCLPYAGGSPEAFRPWSAGIGRGVELLALRLPGHGPRIREAPYRDWKTLVDDAYEVLAPWLSEPHAFYGHSFGARLAYELARRAGAETPCRTRHLFVGGSRSPDVPQARPYLHELSDTRFRAALREMGGSPAEILDHAKMMHLLLPAIREEIRLAELWGDRDAAVVDVPITAMYGRDDAIDDDTSMKGWRAYTQRRFELVKIPAGHFFLHTHQRQVLAVINTRLGVCRAETAG